MGRASEAFRAHCEAWNAQDRDAWITLFADNVVLEDPVGGKPKQGRTALETTWERSQKPDRRWTLEPRRVVECGNEAAIDLVNRGVVDGEDVAVESIEIWRVDDDGKVDLLRVFFDAAPDVNDPWYLPQK